LRHIVRGTGRGTGQIVRDSRMREGRWVLIQQLTRTVDMVPDVPDQSWMESSE